MKRIQNNTTNPCTRNTQNASMHVHCSSPLPPRERIL